MKLAFSELDTVFDFDDPCQHTLVIENQKLFRSILQDISGQINGIEGDVVLSKKDTPMEMSGKAELISSFISFELCSKALLSKITAAMEKRALASDNLYATQQLLGRIEQYLLELTLTMDCDLDFTKLNIGNILKAVGVAVRDDYEDDLSRIIDYMELVREFDRDKLFIFVNMRSYFDDSLMQAFVKTVRSHGFTILLIDSSEHGRLQNENRVIIDEDLCVI